MLEERLKEMSSIQVSEKLMDADYEAIESKLQKKSFQWKVPSVIVLAVAVLMILLNSTSSSLPQQSASSTPTITSYLVTEKEQIPHSIWYPKTVKVNEENAVKLLNQTMNESIKTDLTKEQLTFYYYISTYKIHYSDGSVSIIEYGWGNESIDSPTKEYFINLNTNKIHEAEYSYKHDAFITETIEEPLNLNKRTAYVLGFIILMLFIRWRFKHYVKKQTGAIKLKDVSLQWQWVIFLLSINIPLTIYNSNESFIDFRIFLAFGFLNVIVFSVIEYFREKQKWRYTIYVINFLIATACIYVYLYCSARV